MGKISNAIHLLEILMNGKKYEIRELSELLEVSPRMIRLYKDDLEKSGIYIETIRGRYGGYFLKQDLFLPRIQLSSFDFDFLNDLKKSLNTIEKEKMDHVIDKLVGIKFQTNLSHFDSIEEQKIYNKLVKSITTKNKVYIEYTSLTKGLTKRIIHPYEILWFHGGFGCAAFCESRNDLRHFEIKRIVELKILEETF